MDGGSCVTCGSAGADIHTLLCSACMTQLPPYERKKAEHFAIHTALIRQALVDGEPMGAIRWTEQQYQDHLRKTQAPQEKEPRKVKGNGKPPKIAPGTLTFELPLIYAPMVNGPKGLARMHYRALARLKANISGCLSSQLPNASGAPFLFAKVEIIRQTAREPDRDNLYAHVKPILDAMQVVSKRHPYGAYIITNDDPDHIELTVRWEKASPKAGRVLILITPRPDFGRK